MTKTPKLPDDVDALKTLLIEQNSRLEQLKIDKEQLQSDKESLTNNNTHLKVKVLTLQEQLNLAIARRYAASSEKIPAAQLRLFDEAEIDTDDENLPLLNEDNELITVTEHSRKKKTGRKPLPDYLNNEWNKLIRYTNDGRYRMDNNLAENAIRPFVVGRKNGLFSQSVKGVKASANLYSLIETAKVNNLEPYAYLRVLFTELPKATTVEEIEALLSGNINLEQFKQAYARMGLVLRLLTFTTLKAKQSTHLSKYRLLQTWNGST